MSKVRTWVWVALVAGLAVLCAVLCVVWWFFRPTGTLAYVYVDGQCVYSVDLSAVQEPYTYEVTTDYGTNVLYIVPGDMRVEEADCHDHTCVRQGWLRQGGMDLVCLPHHLVVQCAQSDVDAVAR